MNAVPAPRQWDESRPGLARWFAGNEALVVCLFAVLLLAVNLATSVLYPTSWVDEAMFADPAISFLQGKGFTSTIWWETSHKTWSGNVPLYSAALVPWLKLVGVSLRKVHAFNYTVISIVSVIFWLAVKRLDWIPSAGGRIGMIILLFISYPMCFAYRCARPDCLGMLLCAICLLAWSWQNRSARNVVLFMAGFLVPSSGLQLVAYVGLIAFLTLFLEGRKAIVPLTVLMAGIFTGGVALASFYYVNHLTGVIDTIKETRRVRELAVFGSGASQTFFGKSMATGRRIILDQIKDYGIMPSLLTLAVLGSAPQVRSDRKMIRLAWVGFLASFAIVCALEIFLHYLDYYHWMNHVILVISISIILATKWPGLSRARMVVIGLILAGSLAGGLPLRLGLGMAMDQRREWKELQRLVEENVKSSDTVYSDYMAYFPLKVKARAIYSPDYYRLMSPEEFDGINVLVLDPLNYDRYLKPFLDANQHWVKQASFSSELGPAGRLVTRLFPRYAKQPTSCGYSITILRRDLATNSIPLIKPN